MREGGKRKEKKEPIKNDEEEATNDRKDENDIAKNVEKKEEGKEASEAGMEGEPEYIRLASHQEEKEKPREGSRRLETEENNETLPKYTERLDEVRAEKARAARAANIALIVKI